MTEIALAFVYVGYLQFSCQVAERISGDYDKAVVLRVIAESCVKLGDKEKARSLLVDAIKAAERISADSYKAFELRAIAMIFA